MFRRSHRGRVSKDGASISAQMRSASEVVELGSETRGDAGLVVTGGNVLAVDADPASWETLDPGEPEQAAASMARPTSRRWTPVSLISRRIGRPTAGLEKNGSYVWSECSQRLDHAQSTAASLSRTNTRSTR